MPGQGGPRFRPAQGNAGNWRPGWRSSSSDRVVNRWDSDVGARVRPTSSHRLLPTPRCPVVVDATSVAIRDDTPTSMGPMPCLHRHRRPWDVFCLRPTRMPLIPPRGRHPATSAECSEPVSKTNSGTSRECSQSAVKLTAGLEPGRAGPAGQCTSTPLVKLGATCVSAETQTALLIVERGQPVVNFLDIAECPFVDNIPNCFPLGDDLVFARSPWVPVIIEGVHVPMLLDTGAEVTILSTNFLHRLFPRQEFPDRGRIVRSLGGNHIAVKGPVMLTIEICCQVLHHPVYYCDGATTPLMLFQQLLLSSMVTPSSSRRLLLNRQSPPTRQPFAVRQLLLQLPSTQPQPTRQPSTAPQLLLQLPLPQPPPTRHPSDIRQLLRQLPPTRPLLLRLPPVSQPLPCQQLPPQLPATPLLRRWRPFACRRASPRGPLSTASPPLLHHRPLPTSVTLHVRQQPSLQPPTPPTLPTSTHLLQCSL